MALVVGTNSYGSRTEANTYFADSIRNVSWSMFSDSSKDSGLIEATRVLERLVYVGSKEIPSQALQFPRIGVSTCAGETMTPAESLTYIKEAQFEYAIALLLDPSILGSTNVGGSNYKKVKAGSAEVEFFRPAIGGKYPNLVRELLSCILAGNTAGKGINGSYASGTGDESSFDTGRFDRTRGYY